MSERGYSDDENDDDLRQRGDSKVKEEGDGKEKRGVINRVNRACNHCRRMKMRCVGAEDPPCKRCRNAGLECVMEKPGRMPTEGVGEDRIRSLESQVSAIQNTLTDLVTTLRAGMSSSASTGSGHTPAGISTTTPDYAPPLGLAQGLVNMGLFQPGSSPSGPTGGFDSMGAYRSASVGSGPTPPFFGGQGGAHPAYPSHRSPTTHFNAFSSGNGTFNVAGREMLPPPQPRQDTTRSQPSPFGFPGQETILSSTSGPDSSRMSMPQSSSSTTTFDWPPSSTTTQQPQQPQQPEKQRHMSLPPSRAGSVGPEDILGPEEIINPLGAMSSMAGLVEAAVERAREEQEKTGSGQSSGSEKRGSDGSGGADANTRPKKKARFSPSPPTGPTVVEWQNLPPTSAKEKGKGKKKTHVHMYPDAVTEGLVSEEEAKEMMSIFYAGSSNFIPCYDPIVDTWESLRSRSPFSITAIIMVGARVRDGGGSISDVQRSCLHHAQKIAVGTLFHPVARIEAVQAMILLSAFSENGWLPGGHAVRMAIDMGINRSFVRLLRSGMGKGKTKEELEEERHLVVQSRTWFCLYLVEHQMAYGMGRPAILREDESIHQCRRLLEHPLSITSDARLVSTVELMALRAPLHIELTASPDLPIAENTLRRLKQANSDFDAWERYWDRILSDRFGKGRGDFFRESLIIQRQYAELFVNSQLLRGIREPTDVINMPEEKRLLAIRAMRNAQRCIEICLRGENYRNGLRYAVHYTHVTAAFAASFLIRIARLFPHELNLKKTAKDVEELASLLAEVPAGRYARSLRLILRRARRAKVIPAASIVSSPTRQAASLPGAGGLTPLAAGGLNPLTPAFSPSQMINPTYFTSTPGNTGGAGAQGPTPTPGGGMHGTGTGTGAGVAGPSAISPSSNLLQTAGQIINDSPTSGTDLFEFDSLFAQSILEKTGLSFNEGDQLPLFLDGQSLGGSQAPTEMTPFMGIESFFLPAELDNQLGELGNPGFGTGNGASGNGGNFGGAMQDGHGALGQGDVWW